MKSNLNDIIRVFMFIYRSAPPTFDELDECFNKSAKAGILEMAGGMFLVNDAWYDRIHAFDEECDNEIDSMLEFSESFAGKTTPQVSLTDYHLNQSDYLSAIEENQVHWEHGTARNDTRRPDDA